MRLNENKRLFKKLILSTSEQFNIIQPFVEKDYFVTIMLKELANKIPSLLFKGGTSLLKCHKIIDRFSEDIDLTLDEEHLSQSYKKQMKREIVNACNTLNLELTNFDEIRSRRDYNCYRINYPVLFPSVLVKSNLLVETTYISKSYPSEIKSVSSYIYEYLKLTNQEDVIKKYELEPFNIRVQSLERTFVDKVFAICDYNISKRIDRNSRHIYDLSKIINEIKLDDNLKQLIKEVREDRKINPTCYSAQDDVDISKILNDIIVSNIYKKDYETVTKGMIFKNVPYKEIIKVLNIIIESKIFI